MWEIRRIRRMMAKEKAKEGEKRSVIQRISLDIVSNINLNVVNEQNE